MSLLVSNFRRALLAFAASAPVGCAHLGLGAKETPHYETIASDGRHDAETARKKHAEATALIETRKHAGDLKKAERLLNRALVADVTYGPAHNTLGTVYYLQDKLYLAAWEFEYAATLMPDRPEPYNNLGLVYERAGKYEEAASYYSMAMSQAMDDPEVIGNLVRVRMITGEQTADLKDMISDLALSHPDPKWQRWARDQVALTQFEEPSSGLRGALPEELPPAEPTPIEDSAPEGLPTPDVTLQFPESVSGP